MNKQSIKEILEEAAGIADSLPSSFKVKGFELAAAMLAGDHAGISNGKSPQPIERRADKSGEDTHVDVSDLLKACGENPDRYVAFMHELDRKGEEATKASLDALFLRYQEDRPKNISRDLNKLASWDWIEERGGKGSPWILKRKGRERYDELVKLATSS